MKYTPDQKRELVLRYQNGESVSDICTQTGIARSTFYSWLKPYQPTITEQADRHAKRVRGSQKTSGKVGRYHSCFEVC